MNSLGYAKDTSDAAWVRALGQVSGPVETIVSRTRQLGERVAFDQQLMTAGGRWGSGSLDPTPYVPGDIVAIRSILGLASLRDVALLASKEAQDRAASGRDELDLSVTALNGIGVYGAQPFFLPAALALAVVSSTPPHEGALEEVRLPFSSVLVVFGRDLELPGSMVWPASLGWGDAPVSEGVWRSNIVDALRRRGGALTGIVLFAGADGEGLADHVLWLATAAPDSSLPAPWCYDGQRSVLLGLRSTSLLAPVVANVAAAVCGASWREVGGHVSTIGEPGSDRWARSLGRDRARRALRAGALSGVRVIDLDATRRAARDVAGDEPGGERRRPGEHARRGHSRRVRIALRDQGGAIVGSTRGREGADWHYELRWIPPGIVNAGIDGGHAVQVWRLPEPASLSGADAVP